MGNSVSLSLFTKFKKSLTQLRSCSGPLNLGLGTPYQAEALYQKLLRNSEDKYNYAGIYDGHFWHFWLCFRGFTKTFAQGLYICETGQRSYCRRAR